MAELLGAVSGAIGIAGFVLQTSGILLTFFNNFTDAPDSVRDLCQQLTSLQIVLDEVALRLPGTTPHLTGTKATDAALKDCHDAIAALAEDVKPLREKLERSKKREVVWARLRTTVLDQKIQGAATRLEKAKATLVLALTISVIRRIDDIGTAEKKVTGEVVGDGAKSVGNEKTMVNVKEKELGSNVASKEGPPLPAYSPCISDSEKLYASILKSTLEKLGGDLRLSESESNLKHGAVAPAASKDTDTLRSLSLSDLDKIQMLWKTDPESVENLKRTINGYNCLVFLRSLQAQSLVENQVTSAAASTLEWVQTDSSYERWIKEEHSSVLLLSGKPGSGKSVLTKTMLERLSMENKGHDNDVQIFSFFCNNRKRPEESPQNVLKAFILQFLRSNPDEFARIRLDCECLQEWDPSASDLFEQTFQNLWVIFEALMKPKQKTRFYCFLDAVDECKSELTEKFLARLAGLITSSRECSDNTGPFKLFMSGRPEWVIEMDVIELFRNPLEVVLTPEVVQNDISSVVEVALRKVQRKLGIQDAEKDSLKVKLVSKANGMFLWVVLALREIERVLGMSAKRLGEMIDKLPVALSELYDQILQNLFEKYNALESKFGPGECSEDLLLAWKAIHWVALAARPLTLQELQFALALETTDNCLKDVKAKMVGNIENVVQRIPFLEIVRDGLNESIIENSEEKPIKSYTKGENLKLFRVHVSREKAIEPSATVRLIHQSAKEYVLKHCEKFRDGVQSVEGLKFGLPEFTDATVCQLCIQFLQFQEFKCGKINKCFPEKPTFSEGLQDYIESFIFAEYASVFWSYHLQKIPNVLSNCKFEPLLEDAFCFLRHWHSRANVEAWLQISGFLSWSKSGVYSETPSIGEFEPLHAAVSRRIPVMVQFLISQGEDIEGTNWYGQTPLFLALEEKFQEIVDILRAAGAKDDVVPDGVRQRTEFHKQAKDGDFELVKETIRKNTKGLKFIDQRNEHGATALFYACYGGHTEIVKFLLDKGASLTCKDEYGRIALDVTLKPELREMLKNEMMARGLELYLPEKGFQQTSSCPHTFPHDSTFICDGCGAKLEWMLAVFYHCCICGQDENVCARDSGGFDLCGDCYLKGQKCPGDEKHRPLFLKRLVVAQMCTWNEYSPVVIIDYERYWCMPSYWPKFRYLGRSLLFKGKQLKHQYKKNFGAK